MTFYNDKHTIDAHCDFEFNCKQPRKVDYSICIPKGNINGLVVMISGFGKDAGSYSESFQGHVCDKFSMACLVVDYHCIHTRGTSGNPVVTIDPYVEKLLRSITGCINNESMAEVILKAVAIKADPNIPLTISGTINPDNNEYQNFGVLPALDIIYALVDVFNKYSKIPKTIFAIGSSYGGYIANLVAKFAPSTLNTVFDNSSWAKPNLDFIIGRDTGNWEVINHQFHQGALLGLNVLSPWSANPSLPNSFNEDRQMIRSFSEKHLETICREGRSKTVYYFVHAENDQIANTHEKIFLAKQMAAAGLKVDLKVYTQNDIDDRYIKSMDHGMGLSLRTFFEKCFNLSQKEIRNDLRTDFDFEHSLEFVCKTLTYSIDYKKNQPPVCIVHNNS